jgi:hypothetical protein
MVYAGRLRFVNTAPYGGPAGAAISFPALVKRPQASKPLA